MTLRNICDHICLFVADLAVGWTGALSGDSLAAGLLSGLIAVTAGASALARSLRGTSFGATAFQRIAEASPLPITVLAIGVAVGYTVGITANIPR